MSIILVIFQRSDSETTKLLFHFWLDFAISVFLFAPWFVQEVFAKNSPGGESIAVGVV